MASITKRGNGYRIKVSCGYDINGKQIVKSMTWEPKVSMTARQIEKELQRQATDIKYKSKTDLTPIILKEYGTKAEFAEKSEIAIITLSNACKGKNVSQSTAEKISDALKLKINDIFEADAEKVCLSEKTIQPYIGKCYFQIPVKG